MALSAFINALYETNCVAIVRRVYNNNGAVRIGALVPQIEAENEVGLCASPQTQMFLRYSDIFYVFYKSIPVLDLQ